MTYLSETLKVCNILIYQLAILFMQLKLEESSIGKENKYDCLRSNCQIKESY